MPFKIVYVNPNLDKEIQTKLKMNYAEIITDSSVMAIIEVAPVEQPFLLKEGSERLVVDFDTFQYIIEDVLSALLNNDQKRFEMIVNQVVNAKYN